MGYFAEFLGPGQQDIETITGGNVTDARIVMGGIAPVPWRSTDAEDAIKGGPITEATATAAGDAAVDGALPLSGNLYKVQITKTLVKRAVLAAA
jgi:xanthine dehydrogenase YagS FAD-binding subunit